MSINIDKLNNNNYDIYHLERTIVSSRFGGVDVLALEIRTKAVENDKEISNKNIGI
jgi:hypothetical protein